MLDKDTPTIDKQIKQSIKLHEEKKMDVEPEEEVKVSEFKTEPPKSRKNKDIIVERGRSK